MRQILQNLGNGETMLAEVAKPAVGRNSVLVQTSRTLISAGTERMLLDFGKAGLLEKARKQPDKVRMVLDKIRTDGLTTTVEAVRSKLDEPIPLGYCNVGRVLELGSSVTGLEVGDRIVSNGPHAEIVNVPAILSVRVPGNVSDECAAFTVLASIGLQSVRLAGPTLGEVFVVTGLGLIGLLTVQLLKANGCKVIGIDMDPAKLALARQFGALTVDLGAGESPLKVAEGVTGGKGVDGVILAASSKSDELLHEAAQMCRKRGRIILLGVVGTKIIRDDFYEKELSFQVSCSYGPGRYDPKYEFEGQDYPFGFVRWTEQRNFEAVLQLMSEGSLDPAPLISHRYAFDKAVEAYSVLETDQSALGIVLEYSQNVDTSLAARTINLGSAQCKPEASGKRTANCAVFGAGNFASRVLIPALKDAGARLETIVTKSGARGGHFGKKYGFRISTTDSDVVMSDADIDTVVIATPHNSHARLATKAVLNGKHVFVEKPLALTMDELDAVTQACASAAEAGSAPVVMVGFNRRFAPHIKKMKELLANVRQPKSFIVTVNAGAIPPDHWTQNPEVGGGRINGEVCHFIDLLRFLAGAKIIGYYAQALGAGEAGDVREDKITITLAFADGSVGVIHYLANGGKKFPKERIEVFTNDAVLQLDNFRIMTGFGWPGFSKMRLLSQDKGHGTGTKAFIDAVRNGGPSPIPLDELVEVARVTIDIANQVRASGRAEAALDSGKGGHGISDA